MIGYTKNIIQACLVMGGVLLLVGGFASPTTPQTLIAAPEAIGPYCRAGTATWDSLAESQIGLGWELDFFVNNANLGPSAYGNGAEYIPMIRFSPKSDSDYGLNSGYNVSPALNDDSSGLGGRIDDYPGRIWIVGNEVDRRDVQDSLMPQTYAEAYHDVYHFIKERDPSAQVAFAGLVQVSPNRVEYLDIVWETYRQKYGTDMPVDIWTMHVYPLPEVNLGTNTDAGASYALGTDIASAVKTSGGDASLCSRDDIYCYAEHDSIDLFKEHVVRMRTWMRDNGQQDKPLMLTEYGILYPYQFEDGATFPDENGNIWSPERARDWLNEANAYLETATDSSIGYPADDYKLVQRWNWFRMFTPDGDIQANGSALINDEKTSLTVVGQAYRDRIAAQSLYVDLVLESAGSTVGKTSDGVSSDASVTIPVTVRNVGTSRTNSVTTLQLKDASNNVVATGTIPTHMHGCGTTVAHVDITWNSAPTGLSQMTVQLVNAEDNNGSDNSLPVTVFVDAPVQTYLPRFGFGQ